ncbi:Gfo/Idh/MocA family oxidoreductase [Bacillus sp. JJ1566]|uniref:Gfo/Idh/MocA family protein n=1 Tax=Bacillus sp. JJ1566 TaxID=3122961 RepID=UPI002FFF68BE
MNTVKIAVIGASWFADLWYLPVLKKHPNVIIQAICSATGTSAKRMAEKYGIKHVYTDYQEMLEKEKLDGVCIVTPNDSHKEITLAAVENGVHVICEKPMALNAHEAKEMLEKASKNKVIHAVNFTYREHPAIQMMKKLVKDGLIGTIHEASFEYLGDYGLHGPPGWRGTISKGGIGGILQDLGSHIIDLAEEVLDERIKEVTGTLKFYENGKLYSLNEKNTTEQAADSTSFFARFSSGIEATFFSSWVAPQGNKNQTIEIRLHGSSGSIHFLSSELGTSLTYGKTSNKLVEVEVEGAFRLDYSSEPNEEKFRPWRLTNKNEVWKWVDHINGSTNEALATFEDGYHVQQVIDAVIDSAKKQSMISIGKE